MEKERKEKLTWRLLCALWGKKEATRSPDKQNYIWNIDRKLCFNMLVRYPWLSSADPSKVKNYFEKRKKLQTKERLNLTGIKGVKKWVASWLDVSTTKAVRYDHKRIQVLKHKEIMQRYFSHWLVNSVFGCAALSNLPLLQGQFTVSSHQSHMPSVWIT